MRPTTVMKVAYGLAAFVLILGVALFLATDRSVFLIFAVVGALTGVAGYLSARGAGRSTDTTSSPASDVTPDA